VVFLADSTREELCIALCQLLAEPQFPHLSNGNNGSFWALVGIYNKSFNFPSFSDSIKD
jgi:hypothetical protein